MAVHRYKSSFAPVLFIAVQVAPRRLSQLVHSRFDLCTLFGGPSYNRDDGAVRMIRQEEDAAGCTKAYFVDIAHAGLLTNRAQRRFNVFFQRIFGSTRKVLSSIRGGMREWLKRAVLKTAVRETVPGVRIPLPPPLPL